MRYWMPLTSSGMRKFRSAYPWPWPCVGRLIGIPATEQRQVGAVIDVEAAQVVLVGLALATVLADHQAGHALQRLGGSPAGALVQFRRA